MPLIQAFPLGLVLAGTVGLTLADGSTVFRLTASGIASIEGEDQFGIIVLEPSSNEILLGMGFLKKFGRTLQVNPVTDSVTLVEDKPLLPSSKAKLPPDDSNEAAKAVVGRVIDETEEPEPSDDPNVAAHEAVERLTEDD